MQRLIVVVGLTLTLAGCADSARYPTEPGGVSSGALTGQEAKPSPPNLVGDVTLHDGLVFQSQPLVSTCPGAVRSNYSIGFSHSLCLVVQPTGSSYALTDDISLDTTTKQGLITQVILRGQDIIGADGIQHETDPILVNPPVTPNAGGFTLHVHADQIPVYRLSGHIGGKRVGVIGTVSIWDVVYRLP